MMNRVLQDLGSEMSVFERRFEWQQEQLLEMEKILNYEDCFWSVNNEADHDVLGGGSGSHHGLFENELQAVLNSSANVSSQFESGYSLQRTLSCPPKVAASFSSGPRKRMAEGSKGVAETKMEKNKKKMKVYEEEESKLSEQNSKSTTTATTAAESSRKGPAASKSDSNSKGGDAPKTDYIHVRARRGQATDSHSLAERVRREKISERMKYLQDLVPGCSKITGKAAMLDEIINYVQSLQRQVELLSLKLAAVSSRVDLDMESNLSKEIYPSILQSSQMNTTTGVHFHMDPVAQTQMPLNHHHTFIDTQIQEISWGNSDLQNPFVSSFFPQSFTGEGFMGTTGNIKIEMP